METIFISFWELPQIFSLSDNPNYQEYHCPRDVCLKYFLKLRKNFGEGNSGVMVVMLAPSVINQPRRSFKNTLNATELRKKKRISDK